MTNTTKGRKSSPQVICFLVLVVAAYSSQAFAPIPGSTSNRSRSPNKLVPNSLSSSSNRRFLVSTLSLQANGHNEGDDAFFPSPEETIRDTTSTIPECPVADTESRQSSVMQYDATFIFFTSAIIGIMSGFAVSIFKLSIESLREVMYGTSFAEYCPVFLIPAIGGVGVALLMLMGDFSPGLRGTAQEVDAISLNTESDERFTNGARFLRKPLGAIVTLGTGNSLGPEGPSVEVGMAVSRICMPSSFSSSSSTGRTETDAETVARIQRNRLLLSAGASAGVSAGFNAPLAGVFFSLEILQQSLPPLKPLPVVSSAISNNSGTSKWFQEANSDYLSTGTGSITAVLIASVLSALVSRVYLGESLALSVPSYELNTPLLELPLYLLLGVTSGVVAGIFTYCAQLSKAFFDGNAGPEFVQGGMRRLPNWSKPILGGLTCGVVGLVYPQILFFGYETLNTLLANNALTTDVILTLLAVKIFTTAVAAGSGLVGGTFAPSLFLGGMVGALFHDVIANMFLVADESPFVLADVQAYALVGAAGVLAALFKAPLTASLLLFELTRDYEVLLPVLASAGVGSVIGDVVEKALEETRRDRDAVSWGDLSDGGDEDDVKKKIQKPSS